MCIRDSLNSEQLSQSFAGVSKNVQFQLTAKFTNGFSATIGLNNEAVTGNIGACKEWSLVCCAFNFHKYLELQQGSARTVNQRLSRAEAKSVFMGSPAGGSYTGGSVTGGSWTGGSMTGGSMTGGGMGSAALSRSDIKKLRNL